MRVYKIKNYMRLYITTIPTLIKLFSSAQTLVYEQRAISK